MERLTSSIRELQVSLDELFRTVEGILFGAFDIKSHGESAREILRVRSAPLVGFSIDPQLRVFAFRAADEVLSFKEWLDSIAALLTQKPLTAWNDRDVETYEVRLSQVRRSFGHAETLCFNSERARELHGDRFEAIRIGVTSPHDGEKERVAIVSQSQTRVLQRGKAALASALADAGIADSPDVALAALASVAMDMLVREAAHGQVEQREHA